jgi:hypothetical protein
VKAIHNLPIQHGCEIGAVDSDCVVMPFAHRTNEGHLSVERKNGGAAMNLARCRSARFVDLISKPKLMPLNVLGEQGSFLTLSHAPSFQMPRLLNVRRPPRYTDWLRSYRLGSQRNLLYSK